MTDMTAIRVVIRGRVQGVFFRAETQKAARAAGVCGWVRNLPDGTVEALFEGPQEKVELMLKWCHKGSPAARVEAVSTYPVSCTGTFMDFNITH